MRHIILACVAAVAFASTTVAQDLSGPRTVPSAGQIAVTPFVGTDVTLRGNLYKDAAVFASSGQSVLGYVFDGRGQISFEGRRFADAYDRPVEVGGAVAYGLSDRGEVFGSLRYVYAAGRSAVVARALEGSVGPVGGPGAVIGGDIVFEPSSYSAASIEGGYRHFFATGISFVPYVAGSLGVTGTRAIDIKMSVQALGFGLIRSGQARLYESALAPTFGLQAGFTYALGATAAVGFETGLRYDGALRAADGDLAEGNGGLSELNKTAGRISVPLRLTGRFAF